MALFNPPKDITILKDSVVILTGGSSGIGAALVLYLHNAGAHVWYGDLNPPPGQETPRGDFDSIHFIHCDVTNYDDIYNLFHTAYTHHGHIDHAIPCAGVLESGQYFDEALSIEDVGKPGAQTVLDVNLQGTLNFARIAAVFLRQGPTKDKTLTFVSSIASLRDSPGVPLYQTSKLAVLGLMRGMRTLPVCVDGRLKVNAICPGLTQSAMTSHLIPKFIDAQASSGGAPNHWQTSKQVAEITVGVIASTTLNGKAFYVEGGKAWEFEDGLSQNMEAWLGEEATRYLRENRAFIRSLGGIKRN